MDFLGMETETREEATNLEKRRLNYNLYFSIESKGEEMQIIKIMKKFFSFKFETYKSNPFKELRVFLPCSTKNAAIEFSDSLKEKMKQYKLSREKRKKLEKAWRKNKLIPIKPKRFISISGYKGHELLAVYDEKLQLIYEIDKSNWVINKIKKLIGEYQHG